MLHIYNTLKECLNGILDTSTKQLVVILFKGKLSGKILLFGCLLDSLCSSLNLLFLSICDSQMASFLSTKGLWLILLLLCFFSFSNKCLCMLKLIHAQRNNHPPYLYAYLSSLISLVVFEEFSMA